jgi:proteic killer suppression protein
MTNYAISQITRNHDLHYTCFVIKSFQHKGLERFFRRGETKGILAQHVGRVQRILDLLDDASDPQELKIPGMFLHPLKGDRKGQWAMSVSGNWRITFAFDGEDVIVVNLEDYH